MIRLSKGFRSRWTGTTLSLSTHPFKRIQFGISAFILSAGLISSAVYGVLDTTNTWGLVFFVFLLITTLWMAGYSKKILFSPANRVVELRRSFFGLPLGKSDSVELTQDAEVQILVVGLYPRGQNPRGEDFKDVQTRARSKALAKLLIHTGEKQLYVDESSYTDEIEAMGYEISKVMNLRITRGGF